MNAWLSSCTEQQNTNIIQKVRKIPSCVLCPLTSRHTLYPSCPQPTAYSHVRPDFRGGVARNQREEQVKSQDELDARCHHHTARHGRCHSGIGNPGRVASVLVGHERYRLILTNCGCMYECSDVGRVRGGDATDSGCAQHALRIRIRDEGSSLSWAILTVNVQRHSFVGTILR